MIIIKKILQFGASRSEVMLLKTFSILDIGTSVCLSVSNGYSLCTRYISLPSHQHASSISARLILAIE